MKPPLLLAIGLFASFGFHFTVTSPAAAAEPSSVEILRVPDGGVQPQVEIDDAGVAHLIYCTGDARHGDIYYLRLTTRPPVISGGSLIVFSKPIRVNSQPGSAIAIGTVRGPHLALGRNNRLYVAWNGSDVAEPKAGEPGAANRTPMLYTRLNDSGDAFEPQRNVIQKYAGIDGGGAIAADKDGNVYIAWHAPEAEPGEASRRVWLSRSHDDGATFDVERAISPEMSGACGCCGLDIAVGGGGQVAVLFRTARESINRDMVLLVSSDHGKSFAVAGKDPMKLATCAMTTAAFARTDDGLLAAWETQSQIRFARRGEKPAVRLGIGSVPGAGGNRKHPAIAVNSAGEFIIAWAEDTGWNCGGSVSWQVFSKDGTAEPGKSGHENGLPVWSSPAVYADRDGSFKVLY
jgi:hypothetical protein